MIRMTLVLLGLSGCFSQYQPESASDPLALAETPKAVNHDALKTWTVSSYSIAPGTVISPTINPDFETLADKKELSCDGRNFPFFRDKSALRALLVEPYGSQRKSFSCFITVNGKAEKVLDVIVRQKTYPKETLTVDPAKIYLSEKDMERVEREAKVLNAIYTTVTPYPLFRKQFVLPLNSKITSPFGIQRTFNGKVAKIHFGTDLRAAMKTRIPSSNHGIVVFTGDMFYSGNTVIVDHGLGIFTMYGHLSKILVTKGDEVHQGQILGLSGMTGRVNGPHLHWGVKVANEWIDGHSILPALKDVAGLRGISLSPHIISDEDFSL